MTLIADLLATSVLSFSSSPSGMPYGDLCVGGEAPKRVSACGTVLATLSAPGFCSDVGKPLSLLYVDQRVWRSRQQTIARFLRSHLNSPEWWPLQVVGKSKPRDGSGASLSPAADTTLFPTELAPDVRLVVIASDNSVGFDELSWFRKQLSKTEGWCEYRWLISDSFPNVGEESQKTEFVIFCRSAERLDLTADRWDLARYLNPFARPMPTTDYYGSGDVNLDGAFDSSDLARTEAIVAGYEPLTDRADVNGDGAVDSQDIETMNGVLSGSERYLPGWWDCLETREERDDWVSRMLAIDGTDAHPYEYGYFVCVNFANVLVLNNTSYDGVFYGEPSRWITPGRFNLPVYHVSLSAIKFHSINGILVGEDALDFDSWRFIEPQMDSDGRTWFEPGERIKIAAIESFSSTSGLKGRDMVVFQLDEEGKPFVEYVDSELVTKRLCGVTLTPRSPEPGQPIRFTVRADPEQITQVSLRIRLAGSALEGARMVALHDDGFHDDGAANDGVWGGSAGIVEVGNVILDVVASLQGEQETTYQHVAWFRTGQGAWYVSPTGSDSSPGSADEPFRTVGHALQVAFPGDRIEIRPGVYDELALVTKGDLEISRQENSVGDASIRELHVRYGTGIQLRGISCGSYKVFGSHQPILDFCTIENLFSSFSGAYPKMRNCRIGEFQAYSSALHLFGCLISNPDGPAVMIRCPSTTEPALVPLEIFNCTIVNSAIGIQCTSDDQIHPLTLKVTNSILWSNGDDIDYDYPQIHPVRCDIESGWPGGGDNLSSDPLFVDPSGGNFRLGLGSPCIDAGVNEDWMRESVDLDGNPRIWRGESSWITDMGVYEYGSYHLKIAEIRRVAESNVRLTWSSRPTETYILWSSIDLPTTAWIKEATVPSQGTSTSWTDPNPESTRRFYRLGIE